MLRRFARTIAVLVLLPASLAACGLLPGATPNLTPLKVGLGYLPSVQFAQFYRAQQQGYYRDAGLDVTFQNEIDPNLVTLVGQGALDIGVADGTSVIPAVGQGIPIRYVATIYAQFPNCVMSPADAGITDASGLRGKSVGIPGRYGSSWIMLQALLSSAGLKTTDVTIHDYPDFGQGAGLQQGQVDAATAFRNNEPVQLRGEGFATNLMTVDAITPLPGPGLIVGETTLAQKKSALQGFVAATLRAMGEITQDPSVGLNDTFAEVPNLAGNRDQQWAILQATIEMWSSAYTDAHGAGSIDKAAWEESLNFMRDLPDQNIPEMLTADELVTDDLLP